MTHPLPTDRRPYGLATFLLAICAFVVYLAGNASVPLWDRDEPRYAQCSRQMLQTGDWVVPHLYDELRTAKPPVTYWFQATAMTLFGDTDWSARLPSAVMMPLTLLMVGIAVRRAAGPQHAFWTVLVLSSSAMAVIAAKVCLTDSILLFFITAGQICVYRIWRGGGTWPTFIALGLVDGVGLMTKGPVVIGVHAMTLIGLAFLKCSMTWGRREWRAVLIGLALVAATSLAGDYLVPLVLRRKEPASMGGILGVQAAIVLVVAVLIRRWRRADGVGENEVARTQATAGPATPGRAGELAVKIFAALVIVVAVGLPWAILLEQRSPGFMKTMIFKEVGDRASTAQEGHQGPFGYYLASVWPTFLPWSLILPAALVLGWQRRSDPKIRFALAAVLGPWLMFEEVRTKLPHYLLPCFVPLAFLSADAIVRCLRDGLPVLADKAFVRGAWIWAAIMTCLGLSPILAARWFTPQPWGEIGVIAMAMTAYAVLVAWRFRQGRTVPDRTRQALTLMGVGGLMVYALTFRLYLPACDYLKLSVHVAEVLRANGVTDREQVVMLDYKEPSLAFYQGGTIREHSNLAITPSMLEVVPRSARAARRAADVAAGGKFTTLPEWAVVSREVWDNTGAKYSGANDPRNLLDVVATFRGLDVADGMRNVEVMVVKRKPVVSVETIATTP